jgi:hypothetical protein
MALATLAAVTAWSPAARAAICGDLSGNGSLGSGDAVVLLQVTAGVHPNPAATCGGMGALQCGDMNASGTLNVADVVILQNVIAGNPTLFPPCTGVGPDVACGATLPATITSSRRIQKCTGCDQNVCSAFIDGTTRVNPGVTLTIQPGAKICGKKVAATPSVLVFLRDAKINAPGAPCDPIIFSSDQNEGSKAVGDWGGIVFNGRAPVNCTGGVCDAEGLTGVTFGGTNPNDSSGLMRFVRVEFSGIELSADNELNLITLNGVGRATSFDRMQGHMGFDDGIEWFGGTLRSKFIVATGAGDDQFDWQIGYTGANQFGLAFQRAASLQAGSGHNGYEGDNNENGNNNLPRSAPEFCNITLCGTKGQGDSTAGRVGALLRRGTAGNLANNIFEGFSGGGLQLDDATTAAQACGAPRALRAQNSLFFNNGTGGTVHAVGAGDGGACSGVAWYNNILGVEFGNLPTTATAAGPDPGIDCDAFPTAIDNRFIPPASANVNAPDCAAVEPDFFDAAAYKGGFLPGGTSANNWLSTCPATPACEWITFDTD